MHKGNVLMMDNRISPECLQQIMNIAELRRRKEATNDRLLPITTTDLRLPTETATVSPELPKEEVHPDNVPSKRVLGVARDDLILMTNKKKRSQKVSKEKTLSLLDEQEQVKQLPLDILQEPSLKKKAFRSS